MKPVNCSKPWKGQNGICDRRGSTCRRDSDCRLDEKCCFNGCQSDCVLSGMDKIYRCSINNPEDTSKVLQIVSLSEQDPLVLTLRMMGIAYFRSDSLGACLMALVPSSLLPVCKLQSYIKKGR